MMSQQDRNIREVFTHMRRNGKARHRDIAEKMVISEGELIAAHVSAEEDDPAVILHATRLRADWPALIESLEPLGEVMALTRNESCVHEKTGVYRGARHNGSVGLIIAGAIDLRIFYEHWAHGFAVREETEDGLQRSLQFFDPQGVAVHKIFLTPASVLDAYEALVTRFTDENQGSGITLALPQPPSAELSDDNVDVAGLRTAWASMRDTHEFVKLLKRFSVSRTQALRLADPQYAQPFNTPSLYDFLTMAAQKNVPIMVFAGNHGMVQIHTGPVRKIAMVGPWINVLDPEFNLHLRSDHVADAWVVRKPTTDGLVTSLELFDKSGENIAMFFGERKPGVPELSVWRDFVDGMLQEQKARAC